MIELFKASDYMDVRSGVPPGTLVLTFGISFLMHAILIGAMFFLPEYGRPVGNPFPSAINVSLVSFPSAPPDGEIPVTGTPDAQPETAGSKKETQSIKADKTEKIKKSISLSKERAPLKKVDTSKLIDKAIKNIEKKVESSRSAAVTSAIERLRNQVENPGNIKTAGVAGGGVKKDAPPGIQGGIGTGILGGTGGSAGAIDIYKAEIYYRIQQNWAYSEQLGGSNPEHLAVIVIKVMPGGEIKDIWFERKSGNRFLDESAYRAVQKSNPLPALPREYYRQYYEVGLRFGTGGLNQK
jgi:colicin import membrane protein